MERLALDVLGPLPLTEDGNKYILIVADYFTKWVEAYPLPNQEAPTVAEVLVKEYVCLQTVCSHSNYSCTCPFIKSPAVSLFLSMLFNCQILLWCLSHAKSLRTASQEQYIIMRTQYKV